jgi:hypothetical protein
MAASYPQINGVRHAWSSVEIRVAADIILGIPEINYKANLDPGEVRGAGVAPIAFTMGNSNFEGDLSILLEEFNILTTKLGAGWMGQSVEIVVSYDESGSGLSTIVDTLQGVRFTSVENGASSGSTDAIVRKLPFKCLNILYNGQAATPQPPAA